MLTRKRIRSWGKKSKPPVAAPGGKGDIHVLWSPILELMSSFIHSVSGEKNVSHFERFHIGYREGGVGKGEAQSVRNKYLVLLTGYRQ